MDIRQVFSLEVIKPLLEELGFVARDWGLVDAALQRPFSTFGGHEFYPDAFSKTAALISSIEDGHPFIDGNKRVGLYLATLMLKAHGLDSFRVPDDEFFDILCKSAQGELGVGEIAALLRRHFPSTPGWS